MSESFSPYHEWLGLPVGERPDHYTLLGLPPFAWDPELIKQAAERSLGRIRGIAPGGRDREWMQVMRELLEAEDVLRDPGRKALYDQQLQGHAGGGTPNPAPQSYGGFAGQVPQAFAPHPQSSPAYPQAPAPQAFASPYPGQVPTPAWNPPAGHHDPMAPQPGFGQPGPMPPQYGGQPNWQPPGAPAYGQPQAYGGYYGGYAPPPPAYGMPPPLPPPMPGSSVPDPMAPVSFGDAPQSAPFGVDVSPRFGPPQTDFGFNAGPAVSPAVPMGVAVGEHPPAQAADPMPEQRSEHRDSNALENLPKAPARSGSTFTEADDSEKRLEKLLVPAGLIGAAALILLVIVSVATRGGRSQQIAQQPTHGVTPVAAPYVPAPTPKPMPLPTPPPKPVPDPMPDAEPEPEPTPEPPPKRTPMPMPEMEMESEPTPPPKPEPTPPPPKPEPPKPAVKLSREEVARVAKAFQQARVAIGEQNTDEAFRQLKDVESLMMLPEHREKLERLKTLAELVEQCVAAIKRTIPKLEAGASITIGSTTVGVVDGNSESFTIRIAGKNRTYQISELPAGLGISLANMSLDQQDPVNLVVKGAYVFARSKDPEQLAKAKDWWMEAQSRGVKEVTPLIPILNDTYDLEKDIAKD